MTIQKAIMLIQKENPNLIPAGFKSSWKDYYFVEMGPKNSKETGAVVDRTFKVNKKNGRSIGICAN